MTNQHVKGQYYEILELNIGSADPTVYGSLIHLQNHFRILFQIRKTDVARSYGKTKISFDYTMHMCINCTRSYTVHQREIY